MQTKKRFIKLFVLELLEWIAFATPVFVTAPELGGIFDDDEHITSYWLIVSISIGYVAVVTLIAWLPVKLLFQWYKKVDFYNDEWCPPTLLYVVFSALPCVAMTMAGSKYNYGNFQFATIELVVIMLALIGMLEKMKTFKLMANRQQYEAERNEAISNSNNETGQIRVTDRYSFHGGGGGGRTGRNMIPLTSKKKMIKGYLQWTDARPIDLFEFLLAIYDIRLELHLVMITAASSDGWMYAIYIIGLFAIIPLVLTRYSRYCRIAAVAFHDIPFFLLRLSVLCVFGHVDSILFFLKNFVFLISFIHFNVVTEFYHRREDSFGGFSPDAERSQTPSLVPDRFSFGSSGNHHQLPEIISGPELMSGGGAEEISGGDGYLATFSGGGGDRRRSSDDDLGFRGSSNKKRKKLESDLYQRPNGEVVSRETTQLPAEEEETEQFEPYVLYTTPTSNAITADDAIASDVDDDLPSPPGSVDLQPRSSNLYPSDGAVATGKYASPMERNAVSELDRVINDQHSMTSSKSSDGEAEQRL